MEGKRTREEFIQEEIDALQKEIAELKADKVQWKGKAETAEHEGRRDEANKYWERFDRADKQLTTLQEQLATLQERLLEKEKYERALKQAKGASIPSGLFGEGQSRSNSLILMLFILLTAHHSSG